MPSFQPKLIVESDEARSQRSSAPYGYCWCGCGQKTNLSLQSRPGHRKGEPEHYLTGHFNRVPLTVRFWRKVDKNGPVVREGLTPCWLWTGNREPRMGYGHISDKTTGRTCLSAHRVSYEIYYGPIPDGLQVMHICDNGPCVNPEHLCLGTPKQNMEDAVSKKRMVFGERVPVSKLTERNVIEIRKRYQPGVVTAQSLASEFGVCKRRVLDIIHGRAWRHLLKETAQ